MLKIWKQAVLLLALAIQISGCSEAVLVGFGAAAGAGAVLLVKDRMEEAAPAKPAPALAPAKVASAEPKPVAVPAKPKKIIVPQGANFRFNSAELTPQARAALDEQAAILEKEPDIEVEIAGHTDSIGAEEYNQGLSEKRAKVVKEYLISKGISQDRLKPVGHGESRPITTNDTRGGRAKNRRVDLIVLE